MENFCFVKSFRAFVFSLSFVLFYIFFNWLFSNEHKKIHLAMLWTAFYYTYFSLRNNFIAGTKGVIILNIPLVFLLVSAYLFKIDFSFLMYVVFLVPIASVFGFWFFKTKSLLILLLIMFLSLLVYFQAEVNRFLIPFLASFC